MAYNPSDKNGPVQSQSVVTAVVVDINDPDQSGRYKVRILGEQDDQAKIPDDQLQWINPMTNGEAQTRTHGKFPPANYKVGSKVVLNNVGGQGYVISGAMTNNEQDDQKRDSHPNSTSNSPMPWADELSPDNHPYSRIVEGKFLDEIMPGTLSGLNIMNGITPTTFEKADPVDKVVNKVPTKRYGGRPNSKKNKWDNRVGKGIYKGNPNATEYLTEVGAKELVPNAISMIEQLKKTAKGGQNPKMPESIGGLLSMLGALAGISQNNQKEQKGYEEQKKQVKEEFLRALYKRLTGKEPLDLYGNETAGYKKWRTDYLNSLPPPTA